MDAKQSTQQDTQKEREKERRREGETNHLKEVDKHVCMFAEDLEACTAELREAIKVLAALAAHHVGKVGREDERRALLLEARHLLEVAEKVSKVDICQRKASQLVRLILWQRQRSRRKRGREGRKDKRKRKPFLLIMMLSL